MAAVSSAKGPATLDLRLSWLDWMVRRRGVGEREERKIVNQAIFM